MNKIILLSGLIFLASFVRSQNFKPIPSENTPYWNISGYALVGTYCVKHYNDWYYTGEMIQINDKTYTTLWSKGHWYLSAIPPYGNCSGSGNTMDVYQGALRTEDNLVFYLTKENKEELLFDYSKQEGDTVPDSVYFLRLLHGNVCVVQLIDSVISETGEYLRRWKLGPYPCSGEFVEGIGTNKGIIQYFGIFEFDSELVCYSENYESYYPDGSECDPTVGIIETNSHDLKIFPNPTNNNITLKIVNPESKNYTCSLINIFGHTVYTSSDFITGLSVDCKIFPEGIYNLVIYSGNEFISSQKIIIYHQ